METVREYKLTTKKVESKYRSTKISNSNDVVEYARNFYHEDINIYESSFIILLDRGNKILGWAKISQGGVAGTVIDIKIVLKYVIDAMASAFVLIHNHPSGRTAPSKQDIKLTNDCKEITNLMDCRLLDHIILTEDNYCSMADQGII